MGRQRVVLKVKDGIGLIEFNNPPVNALNERVFHDFDRCFEKSQTDARVKAIILIGRGKAFLAGADVEMIRAWTDVPTILEYLNMNYRRLRLIEDSDKPVIAAIHGFALGGGLEVAMACHFRMASPDAKLGLPEVKLGVIPGGGGTLRLPRLAGVGKALEMCTTGELISATEALEFGIVDRVAGSSDFLSEVKRYALEVLGRSPPLPKTRTRCEKTGDRKEKDLLFTEAKERCKSWMERDPASLKAVEVMEIGLKAGFSAGEEAEAKAFTELALRSSSKNLIHIFLATRQAPKKAREYFDQGFY